MIPYVIPMKPLSQNTMQQALVEAMRFNIEEDNFSDTLLEDYQVALNLLLNL